MTTLAVCAIFRDEGPNLAESSVSSLPWESYDTSRVLTTAYRLSYDVVYIDGLHAFEQTLRDLLNAVSRLNPRRTAVRARGLRCRAYSARSISTDFDEVLHFFSRVEATPMGLSKTDLVANFITPGEKIVPVQIDSE
jgi:hypothetical protein